MCVVAVKFLPNYKSWVGVKNRDRNYNPEIEIQQHVQDGVEAVNYFDKKSLWTEGVNEFGVCILNTATSVKNDEAVGRGRRNQNIIDAEKGTRIRDILYKAKTAQEAVDFVKEFKIQGNTFCFDAKKCFIVEGSWNLADLEINKARATKDDEYEWEDMEYYSKVIEVSKDQIAVRTNHGDELFWAGYQMSEDDENQTNSRISSENRYKVTLKNVKNAETPDELIEAISDVSDENPQMNPVRVKPAKSKSTKIMETTAQIMLMPKRKELTFIPITSTVSFESDFNKINSQKTKTFFSLRAFNPSSVSIIRQLRYGKDED